MLLERKAREHFALKALDWHRLQGARLCYQLACNWFLDVFFDLFLWLILIEYYLHLRIGELHFEGENLVFRIEMVDVGKVLKLVDLSAHLLAIFEACKHDALGNGAKNGLKFISLLRQLYFLSYRLLHICLQIFHDDKVHHEADPPEGKYFDWIHFSIESSD